MALLPPFSAGSWERHQVPTISALQHSRTLFGPNKELGGTPYSLTKAEVEGSSPFFHLGFYLLGLLLCFQRNKIVVVAKSISFSFARLKKQHKSTSSGMLITLLLLLMMRGCWNNILKKQKVS